MARILVAISDAKTGQALSTALQSRGYDVAHQRRGKDVLAIAQREQLDLIVLGAMLPDVCGFEVCRRVRRDQNLYTLPIIMLSAMTDVEEVQHGLSQGVDLYLPLNSPPSSIVNQVESLLRAHSDEEYTDSITELPNIRGVKRALQQRISRREEFGVIYAELLRLREFGHLYGEEAKYKALRHLSRAVRQYGGRDDSEFFAGHLGEGHFVCASSWDATVNFSKALRDAWANHTKHLYKRLGLAAESKKSKSNKAGAMLELSCCITINDPGHPVSAEELLDVLGRIRKSHASDDHGGVHVDRRIRLESAS